MNKLISVCKFTLDKFNHNNANLKFYTGFEYYGTFKVLYYFLCPAANSLIYWRNSKTDTFLEENCTIRGRYRALSAEELFLVLIRLRYNFPI